MRSSDNITIITKTHYALSYYNFCTKYLWEWTYLMRRICKVNSSMLSLWRNNFCCYQTKTSAFRQDQVCGKYPRDSLWTGDVLLFIIFWSLCVCNSNTSAFKPLKYATYTHMYILYYGHTLPKKCFDILRDEAIHTTYSFSLVCYLPPQFVEVHTPLFFLLCE